MNPIAKKLGLKKGMRGLVLAPSPGYLDLLKPLPEDVVVTDATVIETASGSFDFVQFFAVRKAQIRESAPALLRRTTPGGLLWIAYPKKTSGMASDLSRDEVWDAMREFGWRPVSLVAIDDVWSALRFRPEEDVKPRKSPG